MAELLGDISGCHDYHLFLCNSGAEANENALKMASFENGRKKIIAFKKAFHGRTSAAVNVTDSKGIQAPINSTFEVVYLPLNDFDALDNAFLDNDIAAVIIEGIQGIGGIHIPDVAFLQKISTLCQASNTILILDEIQSGFGRTGSIFAFENLGIVPDILLVGKALGGGLPLGAFISHPKMMALLTESPVLGHITTFGGNPVSCAAGNAALKVLQNSGWIKEVEAKENILLKEMNHPAIINRTHKGLWMSLQFESDALAKKIAATCVANGIITDWFLFAEDKIRIAPPLCISADELSTAIEKIKLSIDQSIQ